MNRCSPCWFKAEDAREIRTTAVRASAQLITKFAGKKTEGELNHKRVRPLQRILLGLVNGKQHWFRTSSERTIR